MYALNWINCLIFSTLQLLKFNLPIYSLLRWVDSLLLRIVCWYSILLFSYLTYSTVVIYSVLVSQHIWMPSCCHDGVSPSSQLYFRIWIFHLIFVSFLYLMCPYTWKIHLGSIQVLSLTVFLCFVWATGSLYMHGKCIVVLVA